MIPKRPSDGERGSQKPGQLPATRRSGPIVPFSAKPPAPAASAKPAPPTPQPPPTTDGLIPIAPIESPRERLRAAKPRQLSKRPLPCPGCGYDMRGTPPGSACPECGAIVPLGKIDGRGLLLVDAGPVAVREVLWLLWPATILALLALALTALGTVGAAVEPSLAFALPLAALPTCIVAVLLASNRFTPQPERELRAVRVARIGSALGVVAWLAHAGILTWTFVELMKATPMPTRLDVFLCIALVVTGLGVAVHLIALGARYRNFELWLTGDNLSSLFTGASGILVVAPILVIGTLIAVGTLMQIPYVRAVWRIDRVFLSLAALDIAWRSLRSLRLTIASLRNSTEAIGRMTRLEERKRGQFT